MKLFNLVELNFKPSVDQSVCCLGWFDGWHQGHRALIQKTKMIANQFQLATSVFTLTVNNPVLFKRWQGNKIYQSWQKHHVLRKMEVDYCFNFHMNQKYRKTNKLVLLQFLKKNLNVNQVVVGPDFRFGYQAQGTIQDLIDFFGADKTFVVPVVNNNQGLKISSTQVRNQLQNHQLTTAYQKIYEPIIWSGRVVPGHQVGHTIGFPTLNQILPINFCLPIGVYFTKTWISQQWWPSVTCIWKPLEDLIAETFVMNLKINQLIKVVKVKYVQFWRKFIPLTNLTAIKKVIINDVQAAQLFFKANKCK